MKPCSCGCGSRKVKRGLWSPDEDEKLKGFINEHGIKCWSLMPVEAGLERCGKSCRLRWVNYLRPDLKRGDFSMQEQQQILELQALFGNKWAWIAKRLPGRTDNEIKNFWNVYRARRRVISTVTATNCTGKNLEMSNSNVQARIEQSDPSELEIRHRLLACENRNVLWFENLLPYVQP